MQTQSDRFPGPVQPVHIMAAGIRTHGLDEVRDHAYVEEFPGVLHEALLLLAEQEADNDDH